MTFLTRWAYIDCSTVQRSITSSRNRHSVPANAGWIIKVLFKGALLNRRTSDARTLSAGTSERFFTLRRGAQAERRVDHLFGDVEARRTNHRRASEDRSTFIRQGEQNFEREAQAYLRCFDYDLAVRRAQEAFELYLKSVFRFLQAEYPTIHDVKKEIYALTAAFKQHQIEPQIQARQVARLVLANSVLHLWRLPAFYGDETLNVGSLFDESEVKLALSYADSAQFACSVVRFHVLSANRADPFLIVRRNRILRK